VVTVSHEPGQRQRGEEREAGAAAKPVPAGGRGDGGRAGRQRLVVAELVRVVGRAELQRRQPREQVPDGDRRLHALPHVLHGGQEGLPDLHQLQAAVPRGPPPRRGRRRRGRRQEARQAQVKERMEIHRVVRPPAQWMLIRTVSSGVGESDCRWIIHWTGFPSSLAGG
jgi:hypothetical protein